MIMIRQRWTHWFAGTTRDLEDTPKLRSQLHHFWSLLFIGCKMGIILFTSHRTVIED